MVRRSELAPLSELLAFEDDPALFDPSPEWFVPGLKASPREDDEEDDAQGFRSLIDRPEALSKAWRTTGRDRSGRRAVPRAKPRRAGRSLRLFDAA